MDVSEGASRDKTEDWMLPEAARPRSFAELEARIDTAISVAYACEEAVAQVGADAIESAAQARRAAELAERAASAAKVAAEASSVARPAPSEPSRERPVRPAGHTGSEEEWLLRFTHRAERLSARLVRLQNC